MNNHKICFNFLVCNNYHFKRTVPLYETIGKKICKVPSWKCFFLGGFNSKDEDDISITKVCDSDNYLSCIDKLFSIFTIHKNEVYDWYFIGDDDTFVNTKNIANLINDLPKDKLCIYGHVCPAYIGGNSYIDHTHGGSGILFNRITFETLCTFLHETNFSIRHETFSDVTLALNIQAYNQKQTTNNTIIQFVNIPKMHSPHTPLQDIDFKTAITLHVEDRISFFDLMKYSYEN